MRNRRPPIAVVLLGVLAIVTGACGGAAQPAPTTAPTAAPTTAATAAPTVATPAGQLEADVVAKAKTEGSVVLYTSLSADDAKYVIEKFEAENPGIKVTLNRKSSEKVTAQFITEAKAGAVMADLLETGGLDLAQPIKEGLMAEFRPPAASGFPADFKDSAGFWTAARLGIETIAWNTSKVSAADAPKSFEDLGDPKWKGRIMIEASDVEVMLALTEVKYKGDEAKTRDHFTKLRANNAQPVDGHTEGIDLLIAGQGDVFWGAHAHSALAKKKDGAPVDHMKTEGVVTIDGIGLAKGAPHPNAAKLFANWYLGPSGQKAIADRNRVPAREGIGDATLMPQARYVSGPAFAEKFKKYQTLWDEFVKAP